MNNLKDDQRRNEFTHMTDTTKEKHKSDLQHVSESNENKNKTNIAGDYFSNFSVEKVTFFETQKGLFKFISIIAASCLFAYILIILII